MQLRTTNGYRAIRCKSCRKQETVARTKCQCNIVWHRCKTHRIDPATHSSRKGRKGHNKNPKAKAGKQEVIHGSKRKAPVIAEKGTLRASCKKRKRRRKAGDDLISHARRVMNLYPPNEAAILRLRLKLEGKRKASEQQGDTEQEDSSDQSGATCDAHRGITPRLQDSSSPVKEGRNQGEQSMEGHCKSRRTTGRIVEPCRKRQTGGTNDEPGGKKAVA